MQLALAPSGIMYLMRKSVENRLRQQHERNKKPNFFRRHWLIVTIIPVLLLLDGGILYFLQQKDIQDSKSRAEEHSKYLAAMDNTITRIKQEKIEKARKAEEEAKKKAAEEEAKRKAAAAAKPAGTIAAPTNCGVANPGDMTVVINKKHCFSPLDWAPGDLASVGGYPMRAEAAGQMIAMMNAATAAGVGFELSSAYRSYANQVTVYNHWVAVNGSQAAADTVSARPGYSEHQTGLAADVKVGGCALECFRGKPAHLWLQANAHTYGFIERYPPGLTSITGYSPEAWHWRYVGAAIAGDMKAKGIQTLEQYYGISGGDYS